MGLGPSRYFFYPFTGQQKMKTKTKIKERMKTNLFLSIDCFIIELP